MKHASPIVAKQYSAYVYPLPVADLEEYTKAGNYDLSDPSLFRRKIWPRNVEPDNLDILIAGCGTIQAATYAYRNPNSRVVGIDISKPSLQHQQFLKEKHKLANLELHHMSLGDVADLKQNFDYIVSTGVLHHLSDPDAGVRALKEVLKPHGVISVMLYGYWRRVGVYMMQEVFRLAGLKQNAKDLEIVKQTIASLPKNHSVRIYAENTRDLSYDAAVVDTFLHQQDRAYTVPQVLDFAKNNELKFRGWLDEACYSITSTVPAGHPIRGKAIKLPPEEQWSMVELLTQALGCHRFLLCHPETPETDYKLDFTSDAFLNYIPSLRQPVKVLTPVNVNTGSPGKLERGGMFFEVSLEEMPLMEGVDGKRDISEIIAAYPEKKLTKTKLLALAKKFFEKLHGWDHLQFEVR